MPDLPLCSQYDAIQQDATDLMERIAREEIAYSGHYVSPCDGLVTPAPPHLPSIPPRTATQEEPAGGSITDWGGGVAGEIQ